jgi:hypothetical protein
MHLWQVPNKPLPKFYHTNDAAYNAYVAASPVRLGTIERKPVWKASLPIVSMQPPIENGDSLMSAFDQWWTHNLNTLMAYAKSAVSTSGRINALSNVGTAQKFLNIFLKYHFCWNVSGIFPDGVKPYPWVKKFACAFHAPIDSILLKNILRYPAVQQLNRESMRHFGWPWIEHGGYITDRSCNKVTWTTLDCIDTYWDIQILLRMQTTCFRSNVALQPHKNMRDLINNLYSSKKN